MPLPPHRRRMGSKETGRRTTAACCCSRRRLRVFTEGRGVDDGLKGECPSWSRSSSESYTPLGPLSTMSMPPEQDTTLHTRLLRSVGEVHCDYSEWYLFRQKHGGPSKRAWGNFIDVWTPTSGNASTNYNAAVGLRLASANAVTASMQVICRSATHQWHNDTRTS